MNLINFVIAVVLKYITESEYLFHFWLFMQVILHLIEQRCTS